MAVFSKLLRAGEGKKLKALQTLVPDVDALEPDMQRLTDTELRAKTAEFRNRLDNGQDLNDMLFEAFAVTPRGRSQSHQTAALPSSGDGRRSNALWLGRRDEDG